MTRSLLFPLLAAGALAEDDVLMQADLDKLRDPARREAEVARLADCDGKKKLLTAYRVLRCPQKQGGDLFAVAAGYDYHFERNDPPWRAYKVEKPEELFGGRDAASAATEPGLSRIEDHVLQVFGQDGRELRPFGGDNWISSGYLLDANGDGILERADYENHGVDGAQDQDIQVFELETVERKPESLLRVVFNWHPERADEANTWGYECYDEEGDGRVEIAFGPLAATSEADRRRFVFRWDAAAGRYSADEIPARSHIRVMPAGETLRDIAKAGGLGYPLVTGDGEKVTEPPKAARESYVFRSLKGASDAEVLRFFRGKERRDAFDGPADAVATGLPAGFWDLPPKQAALAFAEANRTATHRQRWKLAMDDRGDISPPASGWVLHEWNSSGCYSFSMHVFALRFGTAEPVLVATDYNSHGVVGRNPLADQPGATARLIPLPEKEASFLAETIFWLDRIRAQATGGKDEGIGGFSSTADGFGTLHLIADGAAPRKMASDTVWAGRSIGARWKDDYSPEVCLNLTEHLLADALPALLGKRWEVAPEIDRRSLVTPLEKRLEPRHTASARDFLTETIGRILARHAEDPVPAPALEQLVRCAGQEALLELEPALERLRSSLPPRGGEDEEFDALRKRFTRDHFGNATRDEPSEHPKDYARYEALQDKRELQPGPVLREPLAAALERLRIAGSAELLLKEVRGGGDHAGWALDRLRRNFPAIWSDHLIGKFRDANLEARRNLFKTLAAADPQAAKDLAALLSARETGDLLIEIAGFQVELDPAAATERVPALLEMVRGRKADYIRRGQAMELLAR